MEDATLLEALSIIVDYNGWYDTLQEIKRYIQTELKNNLDESSYYGIIRPKFLRNIDSDLFPCIIWSILVLQCGEYGTSPRTGWIEKGRAEDAIKIIDALCARTEECQACSWEDDDE